ncbi:hypothetical protein L596_019183 [Steinernema carpocapsae]|uniref:Uncharacterized protein n=1 Tax=Steinernema carpocapsae TaxID=34508 RepID=A0A4U5N8H5_STECR|nr:hypothetical protein L596_019183 [Steinernema carpocapsae]
MQKSHHPHLRVDAYYLLMCRNYIIIFSNFGTEPQENNDDNCRRSYWKVWQSACQPPVWHGDSIANSHGRILGNLFKIGWIRQVPETAYLYRRRKYSLCLSAYGQYLHGAHYYAPFQHH